MGTLALAVTVARQTRVRDIDGRSLEPVTASDEIPCRGHARPLWRLDGRGVTERSSSGGLGSRRCLTRNGSRSTAEDFHVMISS